MKLRGIPILCPFPLLTDTLGPVGSPQPIIQFKELEVDKLRYFEWKKSLEHPWTPKAVRKAKTRKARR